MIDDNELSTEAQAVINALAALPPEKPPASLLPQFRAKLKAERSEPSRAAWLPWAAAIAALFVVVLGAGWFKEWQQRKSEVAMLIAELHAATPDLSASRRLLAVMNAGASGYRDSGMVNTLVQTLLNDSSATVRTAAVEALSNLDPAALADASFAAVQTERSLFVLNALIDASAAMSSQHRTAFLTLLLKQSDLLPTIRAYAETRISL